MNRRATPSLDAHRPLYIGPARVLEVEEGRGRIHVLLGGPEDAPGVREPSSRGWARLAIPYDWDFRLGDTVLVTGRPPEDLYVVGLLDAHTPPRGSDDPAELRRGRAPARKEGDEVVLENGARARAVGGPGAERLQLLSPEGELIFEHDPISGKNRMGVPRGDLEILTREGNIDFIAAGGVRFFSRDAIEMRSLEGIELAAAGAGSEALSAVELRPGRVELRGEELGVSALKAQFRIDEAGFSGRKLTGAVGSVRLVMDRCETLVGTVIEKARNAYRAVAELSQLRTGRMRTLVDETYQLRSKTALLKAEKDFKIDGDKIHLG